MSALVLAAGPGFEAPSTENFWQPLVGSGAWAITRPMVLMALSVAVLIGVLVFVSRRLTLVPGRTQFATESVYTVVRNDLGRDIIGSHDFLKFLPLLFSLFVLITLNNVFSIVPIIQYPTMSRIGFPIGLALLVFVVYTTVGIRAKGIPGYLKGMVPPGLPAYLIPVIFVLEFITYFFTRPVTLALRLFGNMFAGHILLLLFIAGGEYLLVHMDGVMKLTGVFALIMGFVMTIFEILVQFLQAYVFILLTAVYIQASIADEH